MTVPERLQRVALVLVVGSWCAASFDTAAAAAPKRPNVLFIAVDDLADWVGCLDGHPDARTPNIDRLAHRGVLFTNAHCVSPICGPSRAAVLTGMRPETTGVYTNLGTYADRVPNAVGLPLHFKRHGYRVLGAGKVNHGLGQRLPELWHEYGPDCGIVGTPFTHDEFLAAGLEGGESRRIDRDGIRCTLPMNGGLSLIDRPTMTYDTFEWGPLDVDDDAFPDGRIARWAVEKLERRRDAPFFLAVGFYKPHQPFIVPRKYFELFDPQRVALPPTIAGDLHDVPRAGRDLAGAAWSAGTHATVAREGQWRAGVAAYLATIAFADAQVGKVVDALDRSEQADNTWIVLWSDHGWSLGEKEHWGKHDPWRGSLRVPLVIVPPRGAPPRGFAPGSRCDAPVSLLDLYPTLIDACGLPMRSELEGRSLLPLVGDPRREWTRHVVASVGRGTHSVFTERWRYIRYFDGSEELYDLEVDPEEWFNVAADPRHAAVKRRLAATIPVDRRFARFARHGKWKCVFLADGSVQLFDIRATFGVSEHDDVSADHPEVIARIRAWIQANPASSRHVNMPIDEPGESP